MPAVPERSHANLHGERGARRGGIPVVPGSPGSWRRGTPGLAFRNPAHEGTEIFARGFGFERSRRMDGELHVRGSDGGSPCIPIRSGPRAFRTAAREPHSQR